MPTMVGTENGLRRSWKLELILCPSWLAGIPLLEQSWLPPKVCISRKLESGWVLSPETAMWDVAILIVRPDIYLSALIFVSEMCLLKASVSERQILHLVQSPRACSSQGQARSGQSLELHWVGLP